MTASRAIEVGTFPTLSHDEWVEMSAVEHDRMLQLLEDLAPDEWMSSTECTGWKVCDIAAHLVGWLEAHSSRRQNIHQGMKGMKRAKARGWLPIDGITAVQVEERAAVAPVELLEHFRRALPGAQRRRAAVPAKLRAKKTDKGLPMLAALLHGMPPVPFPLGYITDTVLVRDVWMHRVDISRATGRTLQLDPSHDGRLVADAVAEWADQHGQPFTLVLDGPAGGTYVRGAEGEHVNLDAVEFCRILSGRATGDGLLKHQILF
jgi:uncharacterized protein (TIGR03083 family)